MPIKGTNLDTDNDGVTRSNGATTSTKKFDPIAGRVSDDFQSIGRSTGSIEKKLDRFAKGGRV
jgi:hypothetical protein